MQSSNKFHENQQLVSVIQGPSYCDSGKFYPGVILVSKQKYLQQLQDM